MKQNILPSQGKAEYLDALEVAIEREIKAKFMYEKMADYSNTDHLVKKLHFLAQEEQSHRDNLEDLYKKIGGRKPDMEGKISFPSEESAKKMADVEMKDLFMVAIDKEKEATEFYVDLANTTDEPSLKEIFHYLAEEEVTHRRMLEVELKLYTGERPMGNERSVEMVPAVYKEWW